MTKAILRVRMSLNDAHYAGNLVDGAKILNLFGDAATELLIKTDGDEGLFRAYSEIEFLAPVYSGDFIEVVARLVSIGETSRQMEFEARKVISAAPECGLTSAFVLEKPLIVCRAKGTCVTPKDKQKVKV